MKHCTTWEANVPLPVEKLTSIYGTKRFISKFTRARHFEPDQSTTYYSFCYMFTFSILCPFTMWYIRKPLERYRANLLAAWSKFLLENMTYVWPCIIYENDEKYQLDATIVIYYHKYLYMFRTSICPSSGVQVVYYCIWCSALGVVAVVLRSRCVVLCIVCEFVSDAVGYKLTHRPLRTTATTPSAEHHMQ